MSITRRLVLAGSIALAVASSAFASDHRRFDGDIAVPTETVLVRVQKITGRDAADREQVLYRSERGALSPLNGVAQIVARLAAGLQGIPDGTYHDLKVELANDILVYGAENKPVRVQLSPEGKPTMLSLSGTVTVADGRASTRALALGAGHAATGAGDGHAAVERSRPGRPYHDEEPDDD